jgi:tRNA-specific 2-thiouridylase
MTFKRRCLLLFSGGLDSILAAHVMLEQGIEVEALTFKTIFTCCDNQAGVAASRLGIRLTVIEQEDDYLDLIRNPRHGYGRGANPCVDCRIYMFQRAAAYMESLDAHFVISGEVVGQRPMSQKRRDLATISRGSDLEGLLLRPLSARLLPPTVPEKQGWVDREKLHGFKGRSRKGLIALARQFGIEDVDIPTPSTGCALTEPYFSKKVFDLIDLAPQAKRWDFDVLKIGRHFRFDNVTKVIVGRNERDNDSLEHLHQLETASSTAILTPETFYGPLALVVGPPTDAAIDFAAGLIARYARQLPHDAIVTVQTGQREYQHTAAINALVKTAQTLAVMKD